LSPLSVQNQSFDRIYAEEEPKKVGSNITDNTDNTSSQSYASKLRQEILKEISQIKSIIEKADNPVEQKYYETYLNSLMKELNNKIKEVQMVENKTAAAIQQEQTANNEGRSFETIDERESKKNCGIANTNKEFIYSNGYVHITDVDRGLKSVTVIAHENLKDGCIYQAEYRGALFSARVPRGGVTKGQIFSTPMLHPSNTSSDRVKYQSLLEGMDIPKHRWRDKLCNCFRDPLLWLSCMCPNVALTQIRTRLKFLETGNVEIGSEAKYLFVFHFIVFMINIWTFITLFFIISQPDLWLILSCAIPVGLLDFVIVCSFLMTTIKTRRELRKNYNIEDTFRGTKEIGLVTFCSCCVVSQMGRHTADYSTFRESALSATGLPRHLEVLVPLVPKQGYCDDESKFTC